MRTNLITNNYIYFFILLLIIYIYRYKKSQVILHVCTVYTLHFVSIDQFKLCSIILDVFFGFFCELKKWDSLTTHTDVSSKILNHNLLNLITKP